MPLMLMPTGVQVVIRAHRMSAISVSSEQPWVHEPLAGKNQCERGASKLNVKKYLDACN